MGRRSSGHIALSAAAALQDFSVYKKKLKDPEREEDPCCCSELAEKEESRVLYDSSLLFFPLITRLQEEIKIAKNKILR
jgi:hypothetical protein